MHFHMLLLGCMSVNAVALHELSADSLNLLQIAVKELLTLNDDARGIEFIDGTAHLNAWNRYGKILSLAQDEHRPNGARQASCSSLKNHGAFFSVELSVGTPPQRFDVVADTGSDAVIIPSCVCQEGGDCDKQDRCYRGTGVSTTFHIDKKLPLISMEFGSGTIESAIATDIVRVAAIEANMKSGLLLMIDRQLDIGGSFEGILGLGQLQAEGSRKVSRHKGTWDQAPQGHKSDAPAVPGFLRMASVDSFSICFNDGDDPGVLRLNAPIAARPVPSYGQMHWGLNFLGMSVGDAKVPALFCSEGQECGAIPDSGTTLMLGPLVHVRALFSSICDLWPRCAAQAKRDPSHAKEDHFQMLLFSCQNWMGSRGIDELPDIYMHFDGPNGGTTLEIAGWSYVFETLAEQVGQHAKLLGGLVSEHLQEVQETAALNSPNQSVCAPAFGATDIELGTSPLWILGTPLFYEYVVSFDLASSPPSVGFSTDPCGRCSPEKTVLAAVNTTIIPETHREYLSHRDSHRELRRIHGPLRANNHPKEYMHHKS